MPPTITVELVLDRETKNKVRFVELNGEDQVGTIYVPKTSWSALGRPQRLSVSLEAGIIAAPLAQVA